MNRIANDFYPTPPVITRAILPHIEGIKYFFEPCSGKGAIADVLRVENGLIGHESDIAWIAPLGVKDATTEEFWVHWSRLYDSEWLTITNPPFNVADRIIPLAYEYSPLGCLMLLRLSYLEPTVKRGQWLEDHADNLRLVMPVNPRIRFRADVKGTDSVTCAWMWWDKRWSWARLGTDSPFKFLRNWKHGGIDRS